MKKLFKILGVVLIVGVGIGLFSSTFIVDETEQAIVTRFSKPIGQTIQEPGLYFKMPFVDKVHRFDDRFLEWNGDRNEVPTSGKRFVIVDTYARWQITDPLKFYKRVNDERGAQSRLDDIIDGATRDAIADHELIQLVRVTTKDREPDVKSPIEKLEDKEVKELPAVEVARTDIMKRMEKQANRDADGLGIAIKDIRFKQINYKESVQQKVFDRMIAERRRIAELYRSQGQQKAATIRGEKERMLKKIESEAFKKSEEIRGNADAKVTQLYAEAYKKDPDFFQFMRTMESYKDAIDKDSTLILSTDNEFYNYLEQVDNR
jgi:membrane protease subunit HflC